jgi:flagellar motor switch protein FliN/FliY
MPSSVLPEVLAPALARELASAWSAKAGSTATIAPADAPAALGWTVVLPVTGVSSGQWIVWFEASAAAAAAKRMLGADKDPSDDVLADLFGTLVSQAAEAVAGTPDGAGLSAGMPAVRKAMAPAGATSFALSCEDGTSCAVAVLTEWSAAGASASSIPLESGDSRLDAVLEVELPLVVRFGRAVMPLRAVAELSPGAVVDMGRSPDEPVELLVGERLIARGEVVIVGGNYGVRITELTSGRRATDLEARA